MSENKQKYFVFFTANAGIFAVYRKLTQMSENK